MYFTLNHYLTENTQIKFNELIQHITDYFLPNDKKLMFSKECPIKINKLFKTYIRLFPVVKYQCSLNPNYLDEG